MKLQRDKESGFTLVLGLIFILVASMSGLTLMRGSVMQEQMTANMNHKAISFMAAELGANALSQEVLTEWPGNESALDELLGLSGGHGDNIYYEVKGVDRSAGFFIGEILGCARQDGQCLGETTIRVELRLDLPATINLAGKVSGFTAADSDKFASNNASLVIATGDRESFDLVSGKVVESGMCGYSCVVQTDFGSPWNDASELMEYVGALKVESLKENSAVNFIETNQGKLDPSKPITVINGGRLNGNQPDYNGIIIFLGDSVDLNGLGNSTVEGRIYAANPLDVGDDYEFGELDFDIHGGGNATFIYNAGQGIQNPVISDWREMIR